MSDFAHYTEKTKVDGESLREFAFTELEGDPSIILAPATDENPDFLKARLELVIERTNEAPAAKKPVVEMTVESLTADQETARLQDLKLIAFSCARKWGTPPVNMQGEPVEFSQQKVHEFLLALPAYISNRIARFAGNIYNFTPKAILDATALGNE